MKLKTLKDFEIRKYLSKDKFLEELKAEAVKWVKALRWDRPTGWKFREFVFIEFFNLTEEDLK